MSQQTDLTKYSLTFPEIPEPCISRAAWAKWIRDSFSERRKCIIVQDPDGAGKTTLLALFAKTYPDRTFSFFIKPDQYIATPRRFLQELCKQMHFAIHGVEQEFDLDTDELKQKFGNLYGQIAKLALQTEEIYYFVIDGLEWLSKDIEGERLLKVLPTHPYKNMYVLASSRPSDSFEFEYHNQNCPPITEIEIANYFQQAGLKLEQKILDEIFKVCNRMPSYLDQLRREMLDSPEEINKITEQLPSGYIELLERHWSQLAISEPVTLNSLAILAYSQTPITKSNLAKMLGIEERELHTKIMTVLWVSENDGRISIGDAQRQFIANKLVSRRAWVEKTLIAHYQQDPYSLESIEKLPILLRGTHDFLSLQQLINNDYLNRTLQEQRDMALLRRNTQLVAEAAHEEGNWQVMSRYMLMNSILTTLSAKAVLMSEIDALLAIGDYEQSYALASKAILQEDRLQLIARIGTKIIESGEVVPDSIVGELEQLASQVDPTVMSIDRLSEISAELFYVLPASATNLINRFVGSNTQDKTLDLLLVMLTTNLERDAPDHAETLRTRIKDKRLQDFTRAHSSVVASLSAKNVVSRAESIEDVSARLFQLRSWCNSNRENPEAFIVIRSALELMTEAEPNPSMRHLRQFAEPLLYCDGKEVIDLVERFDLLKDTALPQPAEERIRLELLLASAEAKLTFDGRASSRFYKVFFDVFDNVLELDSRCSGLVRMLVSLPQIIPSDTDLQTEIIDHLRNEFNHLLDVSASHYSLTKRILGPLANYDTKLAMEFADQLNAEERRNGGRILIATIYSDQNSSRIDFEFLEDVLNSISNPSRRNWAYVRVLENLADTTEELSPRIRKGLREFLQGLDEISEPIASSFAFTHAFKLFMRFDPKSADQYFEKLLTSWSSVDSAWDKLQLGFDLTAQIATIDNERAKKLFRETLQLRTSSYLAESIFAEIFVRTLLLANRAIPGLLKGSLKDFQPVIQELIKFIEKIPSRATQCELFADLALRFQLADRSDEFTRILKERIVPLLESIEDTNLRIEITSKISPCLFEYERSFLFEELDIATSTERDKALTSVLLYILFERPLSDPLDTDNKRQIEDLQQALRYCEVLEQIDTDSAFYEYLEKLIDALINVKQEQERCCLTEKHALNIAKKIRIMIDNKLPDKNNITHDGYRIAADACLTRLGASFSKDLMRAKDSWRTVTKSWQDIAEQARRVPNLADRALVLTWVGEQMYRSEIKLAHQLLEEANVLIQDIPNVIDRSERLNALAITWSELNDKNSAKLMLQEAMGLLEAWNWDGTRDQVTGSILEAAHRIDPEFAANLSSTIDNPLQRYRYDEEIVVKDLKKEPGIISKHQSTIDYAPRVYSKLARELLKSLCTGRGIVQSDAQVFHIMKPMIGVGFEEFHNVASWSIENHLARTENLGKSTVKDLYDGFFDSLELTTLLGITLIGQGLDIYQHRDGRPSAPTGLRLFSVGTREEALAALRNWIQENSNEYLKIYDPYFTDEQLETLKYVPPDVQVNILTTWKAQKGLKIGDVDGTRERYTARWNEIADQSPPPTRVYLFGTHSTGDSPLHERYYISSDRKGIKLGTSESGIGKKDSEIREMTTEETEKIEREFVDRMMITPPIYHNGEKLINRIFEM